MFWASVTITAVHDEEGRMTGFAKVTRDLSERKAAEDSLQATLADLRRANEELDRFAGVAAHDMTEPLRTISGFAEILETRGPHAPEKTAEFAGHIRASSQRLIGLLEALLTYARAGKSDAPAETVELAQVTQAALDDIAGPVADRSAEITVDLPAGAAVLASATDVRLVLQNLLSNAIKFGDPDQPAVSVRAESAEAGWRVFVDDNGPGIAAADRARIFGAFERANGADRTGYGLGLAICQRLVEPARREHRRRLRGGRRQPFLVQPPRGPRRRCRARRLAQRSRQLVGQREHAVRLADEAVRAGRDRTVVLVLGATGGQHDQLGLRQDLAQPRQGLAGR